MGEKSANRLVLAFAVIAVVFLVSCGANVDQTITFYKDGAWETDLVVGTSRELLMMAGSPASLEGDIIEQVAEWEAQGIKVDWDMVEEEDGSIIYTFHLQGDSLATLNDIAFEGGAELDASVVNGERQVYFSQYVSQGLLSDLNSYTLTLVGGDVISTNGNRIDKGTVQWVNPSGQIEATLTEKSRFNPILLLIGGVVIIVVIALGVVGALSVGVILARRQTTSKAPAPAQPHARYCLNCGALLPAEAKFCHKCGQRRE